MTCALPTEEYCLGRTESTRVSEIDVNFVSSVFWADFCEFL